MAERERTSWNRCCHRLYLEFGPTTCFLGGARALIGYVIGMAASIAVIFCGGQSGAPGFWAMPLVLLAPVPTIPYLDIAREMAAFSPGRIIAGFAPNPAP